MRQGKAATYHTGNHRSSQETNQGRRGIVGLGQSGINLCKLSQAAAWVGQGAWGVKSLQVHRPCVALQGDAKFRRIENRGVQAPPIKQVGREIARARFLPPNNTQVVHVTPHRVCKSSGITWPCVVRLSFSEKSPFLCKLEGFAGHSAVMPKPCQHNGNYFRCDQKRC